MGLFSGFIKKRPERREEVLKSLENLEPITINLNNQQIQCTNGRWHGAAEIPETTGKVVTQQQEVLRLRREKVALEREIIKYARQEQEMKQLKEKLNLMDLKYRVLVEMWATREGSNPNVDSCQTLPYAHEDRPTSRC